MNSDNQFTENWRQKCDAAAHYLRELDGILIDLSPDDLTLMEDAMKESLKMLSPCSDIAKRVKALIDKFQRIRVRKMLDELSA